MLSRPSRGESYKGKIVINAAGVYADQIHNLVCGEKMEIIPKERGIHAS